MVAISNFEFSPKMQKRKTYATSLTVTDRVILLKFFTPRVSDKHTKPIFQKDLKNGGHFEFLANRWDLWLDFEQSSCRILPSNWAWVPACVSWLFFYNFRMSWTRAVWLEDQQEEEFTIPSSWVCEEQQSVYWPPTSLNAQKALNQRKQPTEAWRVFPLIKIKGTSGWLNFNLDFILSYIVLKCRCREV